MKILIPETVCKALDRLEPETRQILLGYIYDYRVSNIAPYIGEDGEVIRFAWPLIVTEFARLDSQRQRQQKSRAHKRSVTVTQELPPSPEREKSPHTPLKEKATSSSQETLDQTLFDLWFSDFWKAYPRKVGKRAAEKKFRAILRKSKEPIALVEKMIAAVKEQTVKLEWIDRPQYCPHPSTWLNQARWEDEVVEFGPERGRTPRRADNFIATPREDLEEVF